MAFNSNINRPRDYDFVHGRMGWIGSITETSLAAGGVSYLVWRGWGVAPWWVLLVLIVADVLLYFRVLQQTFWLFGNPGNPSGEQHIDNTGMTPFVRAFVVFVAAALFWAFVFSIVIASL